MPGLGCRGAVSTHCNVRLPGQAILLPQLPGQLELRRTPQRLGNFFVFLVEMGFHHVDQAGLKLLISSAPPTSASQSAGITGVSDSAPRHSWDFKLE